MKANHRYRSILVPLDGTRFAEAAIPLALSIANRAEANLELVRVHELYALQDPHASWGPYVPSEDAAYREQEQAYLDASAKRLQATATAAVTARLLDGLVEEAILKRAQTMPADLIVMAIHGRGPLSCFFAGSVAEGLVRHGPAPVLLVRARKAPREPGPKPGLKRLLIPLDGSDLAERILEPAIALDEGTPDFAQGKRNGQLTHNAGSRRDRPARCATRDMRRLPAKKRGQ